MSKRFFSVVSVFLAVICLSGLFTAPYAAEGAQTRPTVILYITYETPNKNFLSTAHQPISSADIYEIAYLGDGGTADNPGFQSIPHFYQTATNGELMLYPGKDSLGRGPIVEVVVSDDYALSWDLYTDNTHPVRGSAAWRRFVTDVVLPKAVQNFNFYEFAHSRSTSGGQDYALVDDASLSIAFVVSGYATATDQDYVWTTPNIDGGVGAPSIWANGGGGGAVSLDLYQIPAGAKSLVSPDFDIEGLPIRIEGFTTPSGATSPGDGHFYGPRGFGVYAHEMGHSTFGFVDTYDVVGYYRVQDAYPDEIDHPMRAAMGNWSNMATGGYIFYTDKNATGAFKRYFNPESGAEPLNFRPGLLDAFNMIERAGMELTAELTDSTGNLLPVNEGKIFTMKRGEVYKLGTQDPNQYFYLQVRVDKDYDQGPFQWGRKYARNVDKDIAGGLLIMRIDKGFTDISSANNRVSLSRPYVMEEAHGGIQDMRVRRIYDRSGDESKYNFGDPGDLFGTVVSDFGPNTSPSSRLYYSAPMNADPDPKRDAAYDPNRQLTHFGAAPSWHMSEIKYDPATETVSFKVSSAVPYVVNDAIVPAANISAVSIGSYLAGLGIQGTAAVPTVEEIYNYGVTAIDIPEDKVIVRATSGNADAVLLGLKLKGDDKVTLELADGNTVDVKQLATAAGVDFSPVAADGYVSVSALLIPGAVPCAASVAEIDGEPVVVINGGEVDDEASATFFAVTSSVDPGDTSDDDSGGGCSSVGYIALTLLGIVPFVLKKK